MANIIEELELHKKMINYYIDLINENENISNLKLLLQEIETLHNIILKEYLNHLPITLNNAQSDNKNIIEEDLHINNIAKQEIEINEKHNESINDLNTKIEENIDEIQDINKPIDHYINDISIVPDEITEKYDEKTEPILINTEKTSLDFELTNDEKDNINVVEKIYQDKNIQTESFVNEKIKEQDETTEMSDEKTEPTFITTEELPLDFDIANKNEEHSNNKKTHTKEKQTILESFINEADNDFETINNPLINNKIDDLHKAFSISDRYFITNKLFNNNPVAYSMAIESINQCATIEQANIILKELQNKYQWDIKSYEYNYFYSIIQQKFN
ncbi:MAG TPA: hypothetical protein PLC00_01515 [Bacteroidales bacterium]|nr:hypothetical protein [Bacteroidales bacterium]